MAVAAIALVALVGWALTRSVEPTTTTAPQVAQQPQAIDTSTFSTPPVAPPAGSTTAWNPTPSPNGQPTLIPPGSPGQVPTQPQPSANDSVPRMSVEDLKAKLDRGEVTVVDVRDATSYATSHIPGAIHIPMTSIQGQIATLPKDKPIVTYCT